MTGFHRIRHSSGWRVARYFLLGTVAFLPAVVFLRFAQWEGAASDERWMQAFQVASPFALGYLLAAVLRSTPSNRLVLATNIYILGGGVMCFFHYWDGLAWYGRLREAAVMWLVVVVGLAATLFTRAGFVAVHSSNQQMIRRDSLILLVAACTGLAIAYAGRGNPFVAVVLPMMLISLLGHRLRAAYSRPRTNEGDFDARS